MRVSLQNGSMAEEDENVDVEGEGNSEVYEEYEWAGQRRIRASTLLVGGFAGMHQKLLFFQLHVKNVLFEINQI